MEKRMTLNQRQVALVKTEAMMVIGVRRPSKIAAQINCSISTASNLIEAVQIRWQELGSDDFMKMRIELIEKSREVEFALWETINKTKNENIRLGSLNSITELQKFQAWLAGVTKVMDAR